MSASTHYFGDSVGTDQEMMDDNCNKISVKAGGTRQNLHKSWGELGTPDAAAPIDTNKFNITPDSNLNMEELFAHLHEALALEAKFQPLLYLPQESQVITIFNFHKILNYHLYLI